MPESNLLCSSRSQSPQLFLKVVAVMLRLAQALLLFFLPPAAVAATASSPTGTRGKYTSTVATNHVS